MSANITLALLTVGSIMSMYLAGRIAGTSRTQLQNLGLDCCGYRAARASAGVLVPELARKERRPCLTAPGTKSVETLSR
jgi:hypothetical protein